jgi:hypothetical protein
MYGMWRKIYREGGAGMKQKECPQCKVWFKTDTSRIYCSDDCKVDFYKENHITLVCKECGFKGVRLKQHINRVELKEWLCPQCNNEMRKIDLIYDSFDGGTSFICKFCNEKNELFEETPKFSLRCKYCNEKSYLSNPWALDEWKENQKIVLQIREDRRKKRESFISLNDMFFEIREMALEHKDKIREEYWKGYLDACKSILHRARRKKKEKKL